MSQPSQEGEPPGDLTAAEVWMWQAFRNGSVLDLSSGEAELDDPDGEHEWGPGRTVRARVIARLLHGDEATALPGRVPSLHLTGAYISGTLALPNGDVEKFMELRRCRFEDEVRLTEARLRTARFVGCRIPRLEAARVQVEGDLHLEQCTVTEGIRLRDAFIGTDLLLRGARVSSGRRMRAIDADGLSVSQDLQASLLEVDGEVGLRGASVGGSLFMHGSELHNGRGKYALHAPQLKVEQTAKFSDADQESARFIQGATPAAGTQGPFTRATIEARRRIRHFKCTGGVKLDDGKFGDSLVMDRAQFTLESEQEISLRRITTQELCFTSRAPERGLVVLSGAAVEKLVDKVDSWPHDERLWMAGFSYEQLIHRGHFSLQQRLAWLATATPEYSPGPYEQLANVLRNRGDDGDARAVLLAKQRRRRETLPPAGKLWGRLQDWTVAYGYRPGQAALWMGVLWLAGFLVFRHQQPPPLKPNEAPQWNPALYTLDLLLPVITFGQDIAWAPRGAHQWLAAAMILLGWVLATTVAAGATRLLRRQ